MQASGEHRIGFLGKTASGVRQWEGAVRRAIRHGEGGERTNRPNNCQDPPVHAAPSAFTSPCRFTVRRCYAAVTVLPCSSRQARNAGGHLAWRREGCQGAKREGSCCQSAQAEFSLMFAL
ncbi:hypothetical protein C2845_PM12G27890 [Panicum miliaceum]|uniref:Uncharacterized protein n=1 Tax=Panicum miliaceum TaxID=4540 RepID=A0A3L6QK01_PANMI|nr:hypothetical protein C2845_PM12G27890 [Panicum miliaceum]